MLLSFKETLRQWIWEQKNMNTREHPTKGLTNRGNVKFALKRPRI
jgi:hypothetical protein